MAKARQPDIQLIGDKGAARAIASVRAAFNTALETRSLRAIAECLSEGATLVPGDDARLIAGRDA
ncbi:MAG TPA: nuclear transport factor 2 family protein, partial [Alphaproteobacteria bacterium]|nr:nuclear transport factor 2 family protein [Alphaproteobacteria bacterium]